MYSQNTGKIIYGVLVDKKNSNETKKDMRAYKFVNSLEQVAMKFDLKLTFSKGKSFYELIEPMNMDIKEETLYNMAKIMFKSKNKFYCTITKKKIIEEKDFLGEKFLIEKTLSISDWKLTNVNEIIGEYMCYKAEREFVYESRKGKATVKQVVWYSPELSLPFGPAEFCGFPGLVLKVKVGNIIYYAKKIELNPNGKLKIMEPKGGKRITESEFKKIAKKSRENFINN